MRIYLAGAKDSRLDGGCLNLAKENESYKRLFSFFFGHDLESFVNSFEKDIRFDTVKIGGKDADR